ncbi:MAG: acyl carrier protein [Clostridiales bacterium]|nr:acyl carrier protein [Clostridiales bacterium]
MSIHDEIIRMIEAQTWVSVPIGDTTNLYADLGFNSLSFVDFLLEIEEAYAITFEIEEMEMCLQVGRLIALVENKVGRRGGHHD